ncbi:RluA family pseudouridine synthase, partial [bacterium]|nr:RluA family pseudouridine synthase [bacterium]
MLTILYEDNHLIAVQKPHGMLTQGDETGDENLFDSVKAFIKQRDQKPGNVFLGLLHRLDRPVGGVVLFAKTSKGASRLSEQFRTHAIEKVYWCVVEGSRGSE